MLPQEYSLASSDIARIQGSLAVSLYHKTLSSPLSDLLYPKSFLLPTLIKAHFALNLHSCTILCVSGYWDYPLVCVAKPVVL